MIIHKRMEEVCLLVTDGTHDTPKTSERGYPLVKGKNIKNGFVNLDDCQIISQDDYETINKRSKVEQNDILISNIGTVGECAFIDYSPEYAIKNIALLKPNPNIIEPRFLYYYVISPKFQENIRAVCTGSAQPFLALNVLRNMEVPVPPLELQQEIVSILDPLDEKVKLNLNINSLIEEKIRVKYKNLFVDCAKVKEGNTAGEDTPILDDYSIKTFEELFLLSKESIKPQQIDKKCPYIGLEHMPKGSITLSDWGNSEEVSSNKYKYKKMDVLFGKLRPYFKKVGIAPNDGVCSTDILVLRPKEDHFYGLLLGTVIQDSFIDYCVSVSSGTKMPRTNWNEMKKYQIIIPNDRSVIVEFNNYVWNFSELVLENIYEIKKLIEIRDYLIPRLFSGEIVNFENRSKETY